MAVLRHLVRPIIIPIAAITRTVERKSLKYPRETIVGKKRETRVHDSDKSSGPGDEQLFIPRKRVFGGASAALRPRIEKCTSLGNLRPVPSGDGQWKDRETGGWISGGIETRSVTRRDY